MKKTDIIDKFNSYTSSLNTLLNEYKNVVGDKKYERVFKDNLIPAYMNCSKDTLMKLLQQRYKIIDNIENDIKEHNKNTQIQFAHVS